MGNCDLVVNQVTDLIDQDIWKDHDPVKYLKRKENKQTKKPQRVRCLTLKQKQKLMKYKHEKMTWFE